MISVIIPLYNCEDYIKECIESVLNQSYTDYELIIVNDGSTDRSVSIVEKISDPRIRIVNQENKGLFHARIAGLRAAKCQQCMFLDADDLYHKDALKTVADKFQEGYDCIIYKVSNFYDEDLLHQTDEVAFLPNNTCFDCDSRNKLLTYLFTTTKMNSIVCKAFDKKLIDLEKVSKYPRISSGEDGLFTLELFENANSVIYLDKALYLYRQRSSSISHSMQYNLYSDNAFRFNKFRHSAKKHFDGKKLKNILDVIDKMTFRIIISMALNNRFIPKNKEVYRKTLGKISQDGYFCALCARSMKKQAVYYKFFIMLIKKNKTGILWFGRKLVGILQSIKRT